MGKLGRPRKPTKYHEKAGSYAEHPERRRPAEPEAPAGLPVQPSGLDHHGKAAWTRITGYLDDLGILSTVDRDMLELYARVYQDWRLCLREQAKADKDGKMRNPWTARRRDNEGQMIKILCKFGLNPSDRSRISIEHASKEANPFEKLANLKVTG